MGKDKPISFHAEKYAHKDENVDCNVIRMMLVLVLSQSPLFNCIFTGMAWMGLEFLCDDNAKRYPQLSLAHLPAWHDIIMMVVNNLPDLSFEYDDDCCSNRASAATSGVPNPITPATVFTG